VDLFFSGLPEPGHKDGNLLLPILFTMTAAFLEIEHGCGACPVEFVLDRFIAAVHITGMVFGPGVFDFPDFLSAVGQIDPCIGINIAVIQS
jgi:hypothetical protein